MDCKTAQKMLRAYYDKQLEIDDAYEFIEHTRDCKECKEELSIYYMIDVCNADEEPETYDFIGLVENQLETRRREIKNCKTELMLRLGIWSAANMAVFLCAMGWVMKWLKS